VHACFVYLNLSGDGFFDLVKLNNHM
jgi:hypothetical protein